MKHQCYTPIINLALLLLLGTNHNNNNSYASAQMMIGALSMCGCPDCTSSVFDSMAGPYSCLERIQFLIFTEKLTEDKACARVGQEFPNICGSCNSDTCHIEEVVPEKIPVSAVESSTNNNNNNNNNNNGNGDGNASDSVSDNSEHCGCKSCTESIFNADAGGFSFSKRVDYLKGAYPNKYQDEKSACRQLARMEFPDQFQQCDPDACNAVISSVSANSNDANSNTAAGSRSRDMDLYCYPLAESRKTYENVWGQYTVQVKSDPEGKPCGPGENVFSGTDTVSKDGNDLKLQYKKVGNEWQASEVRVLLPDSERYQYGTYAFSVKSVWVVDSATSKVVSKVLPKSLVLGLFTWDPTEDYETHENYNHEVDIELARWDNADAPDAQFLVQPPGHPQTYRFFSGSNGNDYQQGGNRVYGFDWRPTEIEWFSNAGDNGESFVYSTQMALDAGQPDYNQCMPRDSNNVEVRINLWNLFGSEGGTPPGMLDTHVVEVVIDNFQFAPNGYISVSNGKTCSKDCQCGALSECFQNKCTRRNTRRMTQQQQRQDVEVEKDRRRLSDGIATKDAPVTLVLLLAGCVMVTAVLLVVWPRRSPFIRGVPRESVSPQGAYHNGCKNDEAPSAMTAA